MGGWLLLISANHFWLKSYDQIFNVYSNTATEYYLVDISV